MTAASLLALGSSLGWGLSDFLGGLRSRTLGTRPVLLASQVVSLLLVAVGVAMFGGAPPQGEALAAGVLAGIAEVVGIAALYRGLAVGVAGVVSPASAAAPALPLTAGLLAGEMLPPVRLVALVVLVVGIVLTASERADTATTREKIPASLTYGLVSALGFGSYFITMEVASRGGVPWALLSARSTAVVVVAAVVAAGIARGRHRSVVHAADLPALAVIGVLVAAADGMYATATSLGELGIVAVLAAFHPVVTIALTRLHTQERLGPLRRIGVAVSVLGIIGITAV